METETTGDPNDSGEGEAGEAETLTRDKGGRKGVNTGGTEMQTDSLNERRGGGGWRRRGGRDSE